MTLSYFKRSSLIFTLAFLLMSGAAFSATCVQEINSIIHIFTHNESEHSYKDPTTVHFGSRQIEIPLYRFNRGHTLTVEAPEVDYHYPGLITQQKYVEKAEWVMSHFENSAYRFKGKPIVGGEHVVFEGDIERAGVHNEAIIKIFARNIKGRGDVFFSPAASARDFQRTLFIANYLRGLGFRVAAPSRQPNLWNYGITMHKKIKGRSLLEIFRDSPTNIHQIKKRHLSKFISDLEAAEMDLHAVPGLIGELGDEELSNHLFNLKFFDWDWITDDKNVGRAIDFNCSNLFIEDESKEVWDPIFVDW